MRTPRTSDDRPGQVEPSAAPWAALVSEGGLEQVFAQAPVGIAVLDGREMRYTFANPRYQQIIGGRDPVGRRVIDIFPELAGSKIEAVIMNVLETAVPFVASDLLIRYDSQGTGEIDNYYDLVYHPLVTAAGVTHRVLVLALDVTVRHAIVAREHELAATSAARAAAEAGLAQLDDVFRQAPAFLAVYRGAAHVYAMANDAYYLLVGHGRDIIGKPLLEALPEVAGQGFDVALDRVLQTGEPFIAREMPVRLARTPGGPAEERMVSLSYVPLLDAAGDPVGVIAHGTDVTAHVVARREVERLLGESERARGEAESARQVADAARTDAETANRAKGQFLAVMSHELRTPLNAIGGYAELMEMGIRGPVSDQQRDDLQRIQLSQRHLLGLIDQVLEHARVGTATVSYHLTDVVVTRALDAAEGLVLPQLRARGLSFLVDPCDPSLTVRADAERVQQILLNLLTNAIKFTDAGGTIRIVCTANATQVAFAVTDTGVGIAADQRTTIFEPFVQVDATLTRTRSGVGLGLAISRDLARAMGGDVTVASDVGVGSTFTLTLPRR